MELIETIFRRRSIRSFTDYVVTDDEINMVLESARHAPSWANTQVWEYIIVKDIDLIRKVAPTNASTLIIACAKKNSSGLINGVVVTKFLEWFMFDIGASVQNLCLRAYELGLGTVILGYINHELYKQVFSVPENFEVVVAIPIGKPVVEIPPTHRKEIKSFTHLNKFGESYQK